MAAPLRRIALDEFARRLRSIVRESDKRFAFFVGAGCSVSSGIPTAATLVRDRWLPRLRDLRAPGRLDIQAWINEQFPGYKPEAAAAMYGVVVRELFLQPADRQREIEALCGDKFPGFGYGCLAALMTLKGGIFNVVITTNFDDLLADALYLFTSARPLVIQHEALAPFIRPTHTRPLILKLHGDHRLAPQNTLDETSRIMEDIEKQVRALLHDRGLIFIGYGGNDVGIARLLGSLPAEALSMGVYWVSENEPRGVIRDWLNSRDTVWVQKGDFDEIMLYLKDEFHLDHPDPGRIVRVFDQYTTSYHTLSNRIRSSSSVARATARDMELIQVLKRNSTMFPLRRPRLFSRDGVRGFVGQRPLDDITLWKLGRALSRALGAANQMGSLLIGKDTRESSNRICCVLAAAIRSTGAEVVYAGTVATPVVAFGTKVGSFNGGIVVSASHSIHAYNGLKLFGKGGVRLSDTIEAEIEREVDEYLPIHGPVQEVQLTPQRSFLKSYLDYLQPLVPRGIEAGPIIIDCANGAMCKTMRLVIEQFSLNALLVGDEPDGRNINRECGSVHPEMLAQETRVRGAAFGVAFDGDGDRAIFATPTGRIINGDDVLYAIATFWKHESRLKDNSIVGTKMSNMGLERALAEQGIALRRTEVGDKYVLERMLLSKENLGGEPSGNIMFPDVLPNGDGLLTLLQVLNLIHRQESPFETVMGALQQFPQVTLDIPIGENCHFESYPSISSIVSDVNARLGSSGRAFVRLSQTEPLARVTVEAEREDHLLQYARQIAGVIEATVGIGE